MQDLGGEKAPRFPRSFLEISQGKIPPEFNRIVQDSFFSFLWKYQQTTGN